MRHHKVSTIKKEISSIPLMILFYFVTKLSNLPKFCTTTRVNANSHIGQEY